MCRQSLCVGISRPYEGGTSRPSHPHIHTVVSYSTIPYPVWYHTYGGGTRPYQSIYSQDRTLSRVLGQLHPLNVVKCLFEEGGLNARWQCNQLDAYIAPRTPDSQTWDA